MKMWPIAAEEERLDEACRIFMKDILEIPSDTVEDLEIISIRKVRQARRSKIDKEVLVKFRTVEERDVVQSYATNLAKQDGKPGVRMEIPSHLRQAFRIL